MRNATAKALKVLAHDRKHYQRLKREWSAFTVTQKKKMV